MVFYIPPIAILNGLKSLPGRVQQKTSGEKIHMIWHFMKGYTQYMELYKQIYDKIPDDKKAIAQRIISELDFINETLEVLKEDVRKNGPTEHYINGKQNFIRERTSMKEYNYMVQRMGQLIKQLVNLMPDKPDDTTNALKDFIGQG